MKEGPRHRGPFSVVDNQRGRVEESTQGNHAVADA
jgi:hypothetical protein